MQAVYIDSASCPRNNPFSSSNPATSSALKFGTVPIPKPSKSNEILVRVKASTIIRDTLTWPEMYSRPDQIPGHDFAGVVVSIFENDSRLSSSEKFKVGDEVYGMVSADRGGCWAEYVLVTLDELAIKPKTLSWAEAAVLPLSALTAWQALFTHGEIPIPGLDSITDSMRAGKSDHRLLITGASGGVGMLLVQLARLTSHHVVAAVRSKSKDEAHLLQLGAGEVVTYDDLSESKSTFDIIIDTVGGSVLENCWRYTKHDQGTLITIDSASFDFLERHQGLGIAQGHVKAKFFIVESSGIDLSHISVAAEKGLLTPAVAGHYPLQEVQEVYDLCHSRTVGRGKVALMM